MHNLHQPISQKKLNRHKKTKLDDIDVARMIYALNCLDVLTMGTAEDFKPYIEHSRADKDASAYIHSWINEIKTKLYKL